MGENSARGKAGGNQALQIVIVYEMSLFGQGTGFLIIFIIVCLSFRSEIREPIGYLEPSSIFFIANPAAMYMIT